MRRMMVVLLAIAWIGAWTGNGHAADPRHVSISLHLVSQGLSNPVAIGFPNDGSNRMFINEQAGRVRVRVPGPGLLTTPYLDIHTRVTSGGEQGLLGIAFHPNFKTNGYFFVSYTLGDGSLRVSRFHATPSSNTASSSSEYEIIRIYHPTYQNHNGGQVQFGRDGYLYLGTGDGGSGGDPNGNAQNLSVLLGKILRLDINRACGRSHYCIPSSNPYATYSNRRHEIYEYGLRNPWRYTFDRSTGSLWIGDVGQNDWEEVDTTTQSARNFGWDCLEGNHNMGYGGSYCNPATFHPTAPITEYGHTNGRCSITGGYVYRGSTYNSVMGATYIYADYCTGEIFGLGHLGSWVSAKVGDDANPVSTFGEDTKGELFLADFGGHIYHLHASAR